MDNEKHMAKLAVTIPSSLEAAVRDLSTQRKASLDSLVSAALSEYVHSSPRRMYQISTSTALVEGVYSGSVSSSILLEHGDFGVGTFEGLDGEMVILDGEIYQAAGSVRRRSDDFLVPFASITHFREDAVVQIEKAARLKDIELACEPHRVSENLFYALRVVASLTPYMHVQCILFRKDGEHHRSEFVDSAPVVILGTAAARTKKYSPDKRRNRSQRGGSRPHLSGIRHAGPDLPWACRDRCRTRFVNRGLSALPFRSGRLRLALLREAGSSAQDSRGRAY
jgi:hypothetical protein